MQHAKLTVPAPECPASDRTLTSSLNAIQHDYSDIYRHMTVRSNIDLQQNVPGPDCACWYHDCVTRGSPKLHATTNRHRPNENRRQHGRKQGQPSLSVSPTCSRG